MCGIFTRMASWDGVVDFSQPLTTSLDGNDEVIRLRVGQPCPVIVFDQELRERIEVPMRWGFPHPKNPNVIAHFHCRSETIDSKPTFAGAFLDGQRGIVVVRTFNEAREVPRQAKGRDGQPKTVMDTEQFVIDPGEDAPLGFAVVWQTFEVPGMAEPMRAFVQVTAPANQLIASTDPQMDRMPAFIEYASWPAWLGEVPASVQEVKSLLKTVEGVRWKMNPEEKRAQAKKEKRKPTVRDPTPGLF